MAAAQWPRGLTELNALNRVHIRQKTSVKNKYRILSPEGREILYAKEESHLLHAMFSGKNRSFHMDILDADNVEEQDPLCNTRAMFGQSSQRTWPTLFSLARRIGEVINLRRPYTFGPDKMDVTVGKQLASVVRQETTFLKPVLSLNDAGDRPVFRIKGPIGRTGEADFDVFDRAKNKVGVIRKKWGGFSREMFTDSDNYEIVFPPNLDVRFKAALIGACMLIDFLFYEH